MPGFERSVTEILVCERKIDTGCPAHGEHATARVTGDVVEGYLTPGGMYTIARVTGEVVARHA